MKPIDKMSEEEVREYAEKLQKIIQHACAERTGIYFICGEGEDKEEMGLPNTILVCPAFELDGQAMYEKAGPYRAPEW